MSLFEQFPGKEELIQGFRSGPESGPMKINNHIHSPYSFSAFSDIGEAVHMAAGEDVRVLGINDFYVADGYDEFISKCTDHGIFPLLNIELIGISKEDQQNGIRVNDPGNPGRTYISGKGLSYPFELPPSQEEKLKSVIAESNSQVAKMIELLNQWMLGQEVGIEISVEEIMGKLAHNLLRERHVVKILRLRLEEKAGDDQEFYALLEKLYAGKTPKSKRSDIAGTENELRSMLLKSGAPAFVPEDSKAFLPLEDIVKIIRVAGGIPTYPLLLDGAGEHITEFEDGKEQLMEKLVQRGFSSIEFIPLRNQHDLLKEYVEYFYKNDFVVSFGTEHNTSAMLPITVSAKGGVELDESMKTISYRGAAFVAAHQYLVSMEGPGYLALSRDEMELLGEALFKYYFDTINPSFARNQ